MCGGEVKADENGRWIEWGSWMVRSERQRTAFELQPLPKGPSTQMVATMTGTVQGGLLETLVSHQKTDAFCLEGIHLSDDGSWRNFSLGLAVMF
jgi:hypothetical protein